MAEYYFEIADERPPIPSGPVDLTGVAEARVFALQYAGDLLANQKQTFWRHPEWKMTCTDKNRIALFTISITSADATQADDLR